MAATHDPPGRLDYEELITRFEEAILAAVPPDATVLVVSRGDRHLVSLEGRRAWHFPQRADGVYAGYYPPDSAGAIAHLEALRARGAGYIAFPSTAFWWFEHYGELARHLEENYALVAREDDVCAVYELAGAGASTDADASVVADRLPEPRSGMSLDQLDPATAGALKTLFDRAHYEDQVDRSFESVDAALLDYLNVGISGDVDPHELFDAGWYLRRHPEVARSGQNPLLHFVEHCSQEQPDPNPYFDTAYYYAQAEHLRRDGHNALVHYVEQSPANASFHPNPLFRGGYYLRTSTEPLGSRTPLGDYIQRGWLTGRFASHIHQDIARQLTTSSRSTLLRGHWKRGAVLFFAEGDITSTGVRLAEEAERLAADHRLDSVVIVRRRAGLAQRLEGTVKLLVLEDYEVATEALRPSAARLLARALAGSGPLFAVSELSDVLYPLRSSGVGAYYSLPEAPEVPARHVLQRAVDDARRVIVPDSAAFSVAAERLGRHPTNVARAHRQPAGDRTAADALLEIAYRDFGVTATDAAPAPSGPRKIIIPCCDWGVSGVNASLEMFGRRMLELGWDVEILFTRDRSHVVDSVPDEAHLPRVPYRYLKRRRSGIEGMWEALIADLQSRAPCVLFTAYDFLANAVVPALTDDIGVVTWVQADDGDYYEQSYRLGPYCDAIVCVSEHIRDNIAALNPALSRRTEVIHNSSVSASDVVARRRRSATVMRLVYTGRLVQYQKRVLDFIDLARALDKTGVPYEIMLIGAFSAHDGTKEVFLREAHEHLESGRIKLPGRKAREDLLAALTEHDFFVLLSDFEGLPLSLVEAMARGCVPVTAWMDSGIPEVIDHGVNGLVFEDRDYDAWAQDLIDLWSDRRRFGTLSQHARTTVRERFSIEKVGQLFEALFERVAADAAAGRLRRPAALTWGPDRSPTGDVLPPPSIHRPNALDIAGLR